jgi:hypothetical protein
VTYDDERVVALLKDSVPEVPDSPARVDAVRRLAARQKAFVPIQALGAAASVVLVLAGVTAVARPGTASRELRPAADPVAALANGVRQRQSARFEMRVHVENGLIAPTDTVLTGAFTKDGDALVDPSTSGTLSTQEMRVVAGVTYRALMPGESAPPGKRWVRMSRSTDGGPVVDLWTVPEHLRDARYVGRAVVRGVEVLEYEATADTSVIPGVDSVARMTFALDADGLPRRLASTVEGGGSRVSFSMELFDYGARVVVTAPPSSEVVDEAQVNSGVQMKDGVQVTAFPEVCATDAGAESALTACLRAYESLMAGTHVTCTHTWRSREAYTYRCTDGKSGGA